MANEPVDETFDALLESASQVTQALGMTRSLFAKANFDDN
jgi:hypothetical protein